MRRGTCKATWHKWPVAVAQLLCSPCERVHRRLRPSGQPVRGKAGLPCHSLSPNEQAALLSQHSMTVTTLHAAC